MRSKSQDLVKTVATATFTILESSAPIQAGKYYLTSILLVWESFGSRVYCLPCALPSFLASLKVRAIPTGQSRREVEMCAPTRFMTYVNYCLYTLRGKPSCLWGKCTTEIAIGPFWMLQGKCRVCSLSSRVVAKGSILGCVLRSTMSVFVSLRWLIIATNGDHISQLYYCVDISKGWLWKNKIWRRKMERMIPTC